MIRIYHNPRCRKSRETLQILRDSGHEPEIIEYLKTPPSVDELKILLAKMNMKAEELIRKGEKIYKSEFKGISQSEDEWVIAITKNPVLMERPVVVNGDKAVLGRPPEKVREIL